MEVFAVAGTGWDGDGLDGWGVDVYMTGERGGEGAIYRRGKKKVV